MSSTDLSDLQIQETVAIRAKGGVVALGVILLAAAISGAVQPSASGPRQATVRVAKQPRVTVPAVVANLAVAPMTPDRAGLTSVVRPQFGISSPNVASPGSSDPGQRRESSDSLGAISDLLSLRSVSPIPISATPAQPTAVAANDRASVGNEADAYGPDPELLDPRVRAQMIGAHRECMRGQPTSTPAQIPAQSEATPAVTPIPSSPVSPPPSPSEVGVGRWIDVDLTAQRVTAYEGMTPVRGVTVSTGLPYTPTPAGQFRIWTKLRYDDMEGAGYYLRDVPYVMYFHAGYGLHGTYWHSNFGHPMSHGCVNLPTPEAEWLFHWAEVGTLVNVHS